MKINTLRLVVLLVPLLIAGGNSSARADEQAPGLYGSVTRRMAQNFEPSYITFLGGYNRSKSINTDDLWYEAQLYLHLNWYDNCQKENDCDKEFMYRIFLPIRLQIRQYQTYSSPVKTPSYNPGARVYFWWKSWMRAADDFQYLSFGAHHYSNGQAGPHIVNGMVNTEDGSFSSDYVELAYYRERGDYGGRASVRKYLTSLTWEPAQTNYYETWLTELSGKKKLSLWGSVVQVTVGYKSGRTYVSPGNNASFKDNLQYRAEWFIPVRRWKDVEFYVRWDKGYDYYNIDYENKINRVQAGFAAHSF